MEQATMPAVKYVELMTAFTAALGTKGVEVIDGRRFDRVRVDGVIKYFVDRNSWEIYGAKSHFQYNPRRWYGTLESVSEYEWAGQPTPKSGTNAAQVFADRETAIVQNYKPRGRPKKVKP